VTLEPGQLTPLQERAGSNRRNSSRSVMCSINVSAVKPLELMMRTLTLLWILLALGGCADEVFVGETPTTSSAAEASQTPVLAGAVDSFENDQFEEAADDVAYLRSVIPGRVYTVQTQPFENVAIHITLGKAEFRVLDSAAEPVLNWTSTSEFMDEVIDPVANEGFVALSRPGLIVEFRSADPIDFARFEFGQGSEPTFHDPLAEVPDDAVILFVAHAGRWQPPADVTAISDQQYLPYSGAPSSCSGTFRPGTRDFAEFLKREFVGATSYGGYACRANTANTSQLSVHASGRAIDLFVPLYGGEADNDLGDPIAEYLIMNAQALGIEFIVWDRTSWGASRSAPKQRAYTGPHPHHDHLHIELSPNASNTTGRTYPPINRDASPVGYLDSAGCDLISGWAQDPDAPDRAIPAHIYFNGPAGAAGAVGYNIEAKNRREDLCAAIGSCDHGFAFPTPRGFLDGQPHEVYVYGIDVSGGANVLLGSSPKTLQCDRPKLPFAPEYGIRRHVQNPESMAAWGFDFNDIVVMEDAELATLFEGDVLPIAPSLAQVDGEPEVYLVEPGVRRHVPSGAVMNTWKFAWDTIAAAPSLDEYYPSAPVTERPFLARGSDGAVFLVEPPPALWADELELVAPAKLGRGQVALFGLVMRNRGSVSWLPEAFSISTAAVCTGCESPLEAEVAAGESTYMGVEITAPNQIGQQRVCFSLSQHGFGFDAVGQGGPFEDLCVNYEVVENSVELTDQNRPDFLPEGSDAKKTSNFDSVSTERGCNSVGAMPGFLSLLGLLGWRRRRQKAF
jgi:hypothetical protein